MENKNDKQRPGDVSPYTPFTKFCLKSLPPLSNFSFHAEEARIETKPEPKEQPSDEPPPCGCSRTKCLKLYCECFSANRYCSNCNCKNCKNKPEYEEILNRAKMTTKERNPAAFRADLSTTYKGCFCKRSGCKKKYCECFEEGRTCSASCKCEGCKNLPNN